MVSEKPSLREPGRLFRFASRRHATNELRLVWMALFASGSGLDGSTGIHPRKGNIFFFLFAIAANDARAETTEPRALLGEFEVGRNVLLQ